MSPQLLAWLTASALVAAFQIAAALRLWAAARRPAAARADAPPVTIVVPCKDGAPALAENAAALLAQTYAGPWESLFVVSSAEDSAAGALAQTMAWAPRANARLLVSGLSPNRSSAKALNMAFATSHAHADSEIFLFADSDVLVAPDWIERMIEPLADPAVAASTAVMVYRSGALGSRLRLLWMAAGLPYFEALGCLSAGSLAIRRADFESLNVAGLWRENVSDDLSLAARLRERGRAVRLVLAAAPASREACGLGETAALFNRWMTLFRHYDARLWLLSLGQTVFKLAALALALSDPPGRPLLLLVVGGDIAFMGIVLAALRRSHPEVPLGPTLLAPLLLPLYAVNFAASACAREIVWAGYTYHFRGGGRFEAEPGARAASLARLKRLRQAAGVMLGGAVLGLGYRPGCWGAAAWLVFVPLLWVIKDERPWDAFCWGWLFGICACAAGMPWLPATFQKFLGVGPAEGLAWSVAFSSVQALRWALPCAVARWAGAELERRGWERAAAVAAAFAPTLVAAERWLPGLPPAALANTQIFHLPTVQGVEILGLAGVAWLLAGANAAAFAFLGRPSRSRLALLLAAAGALLANELWGRRRMAQVDAETALKLSSPGGRLRVGLVQSSFEPAAPPDPPNVPPYAELSKRVLERGGADLIVWPENSYDRVVDYARGRAAPGGGLPDLAGTPLLVNAVGRDPGGAAHNVSILALSGGRSWQVAEKVHLIPFGEYMPLGNLLPILHRISPRTARLAAGRSPSVLLAPGGARILTLICYEDLIEDSSRAAAALGADLLVNQASNLPFPSALAHEQHLRASVLRAVESRRYLLRAVNTGVSAVVDPAGRIVRSLPAYEEGVLVADAALLDSPARRRGRFGYGAATLLTLLIGGLVLTGRAQSLTH